MFARKVAVRLQPNSLAEFTSLMEHEILPWLRTQPGFLDLIALAAPDGSEVATISFWDHEDNAENFSASGYPEALKILARLMDGKPYVKTFNVISSTVHSLAPAVPSQSGTTRTSTTGQETGPLQIEGSAKTRT